ncbi:MULTISPECIES: DUF134 domain-containing protein [Vibrio]|jgi:predicted DNA-binding protein (UPF0251 family)|uniref:UPF0251 protein COR51_01110 n=1 Tax=Vibrio mediterranei TaxID=689 RepID=A0ABX5DHL7_9VIBR|nr:MULTISPECIES: DUF134 domain-containing protein [Vibrio]EDL53185.1 hypothetical protein VSAK1_01382 [Vibrio mediterranei AK1]KFA96968.1 hypothetical protein HW45_16920 [Vibrio sp. ER1A]MCG9657310.1 DUF134 domain-containing protein [Vibrio mediterranei]MCG9664979.1 DUF134 domain-containing protein [Vibrio mediterranei]MCY9853288.1 DUF134 domain-containing protein [Vibrio mediterranei]
MARPKKQRRICGRAPFECFKPNGVPLSELDKMALLPDELEALRLADLNGMNQIDAAKEMQVSRQTFANIVKSARLKVATCLINGQALVIE